MDSSIATALNTLKRKRQELLSQVIKLNAAIETLESTFGDDSPTEEQADEQNLFTTEEPRLSPAPQNSNMPGPLNGLTIHEAAVRVLKARGMPLKTRFIADELTRLGLRSSSMYRAVYNSLAQSNTAYITGRGEWGLTAWRQDK